MLQRPHAWKPADDDEQVRAWLDYAGSVRKGPVPSFSEQWQRYQEIYAGRDPALGPPPAWTPTAESIAQTSLGRLMAELRLPDYAALWRFSVTERERFWGLVVERLGIVFEHPPEQVLDLSAGPAQPRWLPGARLNIAESCFLGDPERPAVIEGGEAGEELWVTSLGDLNDLSRRVAGGLQSQGFGPGDAIALYMPMDLACVAAYLGIVRAGMAAVSVADSFSPEELRKRLDISQARGVITVESYRRGGKDIELYGKVRTAGAPRTIVIPATDASVPALREGDLLWSELVASPPLGRSLAADPEAVTNILFSSGTTGAPKAIPWTHLTPIKCGMDGRFHQDIRPGEVVAWPTNIGWMMGPWLIYASLLNGAAMALWQGAPGGAGFARFVERARVSMLGLVPSLVRAWRQSGALDGVGWSHIRAFSSTGEPSSREDYLWLMSRTGYRAPVIEYLGGTEIGGGHLTGTMAQAASPSTFTTPALGIDFAVLGADDRPVGDGRMGELYLVPPAIGLSQRLLNRDHDEVYFKDCPTGPGGEVLRRHGDEILALHRGYYRARGRSDDTMNLGGIKVSSLELEQVLDEHEAVYESAAVAVQPTGEGMEQLVVYVVVQGEIELPALKAELGRLVARKLNPLFKIHDLVVRDRLPRTASNKLMRRELRREYLEQLGE